MDNILTGNRVYGIEYTMGDNNVVQVHCVLMKKGHGTIKSDGHESFSTLRECLESLDHKIPVALCVSGKGILVKKISKSLQVPSIQDVFPSASEKDFVAKEYAQAEHVFYAMARKEVLDELKRNFTENKFKVAHITLSGLVYMETAPYTDYLSKVGNHHFTWEEGQLSEYTYQDAGDAFYINVPGVDIPLNLLPAFSAGLSFFGVNWPALFKEDIVAGRGPGILEDLGFMYDRNIRHITIGALATVFILLFLNFALLAYFRNEVAEVQEYIAGKESSLEQVNLVQKQIAEQEAIGNQFRMFRQYSYSQVLDELGMSVPKVLKLERLELNPRREKRDKGRTIEIFDQRVMEISGLSNEIGAIYYWIQEIKKFPWAADAGVVDMEEEKEGLRFNIKIKIAPDA